jgi:hypothetical protein
MYISVSLAVAGKRILVETVSWLGAIARRYGLEESGRELGQRHRDRPIDLRMNKSNEVISDKKITTLFLLWNSFTCFLKVVDQRSIARPALKLKTHRMRSISMSSAMPPPPTCQPSCLRTFHAALTSHHVFHASHAICHPSCHPYRPCHVALWLCKRSIM